LEHFEEAGYSLLRLTAKGRDWLSAHPQAPAAGTQPRPAASTAAHPQDETQKPTSPDADTGAEEYDKDLFERLRTWQLAVARETGKAPFMVVPLSTLKQIAACRPANLQELAAIKGIGPHKLEQYGPAIIAIIADQRAPSAAEEGAVL
jgi:ATP-dependent DNA helicase RecQ